MGKINWGRVIGGGLVAGLVGNVLEALHGFLMKAQYEQMMKSIHKDMAEPKALVAHLVWSFVLGIASIWLYAAIRPRYDYEIEPIEIRIGARSVLGLSATDSCRDRLAAFFHWNDRPGLQAAVQIALRNRVDLERIREWSERQGASARFQVFLEEIERVRRRRSARKRGRKK